MRGRVAGELMGVFIFWALATLYFSSSDPAYSRYVLPETTLFSFSGAIFAALAFKPEPPSVSTESSSSHGAVSEHDGLPPTEFDQAKAMDGVELVERLAKVNPTGFEHSEIDYNYPGLRGKFVKGKPPQELEKQEENEPPSELGQMTAVPPEE